LKTTYTSDGHYVIGLTVFIIENEFITSWSGFSYWTRGLGEGISDISALFKCEGDPTRNGPDPSEY
jgi:hypothetical protein